MSESQAQGQTATAESQTQGSDAGQVQGQENEGRTLTWEEHQAELKRIGTKEKKQGRGARETELLEASGAESIDDLVAAYTAQQEISAELEGQQVTDLKNQHKVALKEVQDKAERYETALNKYLEGQRDGLPAHITTLLDKMDPADQLDYIAENREAIATEGRPQTVGRGSSPGSSPGSTQPGGNGTADYGSALLGFLQSPPQKRASVFGP